MDRWRGRVALVTGASVGIGAEICRQLAKNGLKVVGCARGVDKVQAIANEFPPGTIRAIRCDLTKEEEIMAMFSEIKKVYGRLDVCINNAGYTTKSSLLTGTVEEWRGMLDVNVVALCLCTKEAVKIMKENKIDDGQIIQISSMAGHRTPGGCFFYSGSKFMVRTLAEGLRQELKEQNSHIRVACISPGLVKTEFSYRMNLDEPQKAEKLYSSIDVLLPEDIAAAVLTILQTPPRVDINDILIRPVEQKI